MYVMRIEKILHAKFQYELINTYILVSKTAKQ